MNEENCIDRTSAYISSAVTVMRNASVGATKTFQLLRRGRLTDYVIVEYKVSNAKSTTRMKRGRPVRHVGFLRPSKLSPRRPDVITIAGDPPVLHQAKQAGHWFLPSARLMGILRQAYERLLAPNVAEESWVTQLLRSKTGFRDHVSQSVEEFLVTVASAAQARNESQVIIANQDGLTEELVKLLPRYFPVKLNLGESFCKALVADLARNLERRRIDVGYGTLAKVASVIVILLLPPVLIKPRG